MADTTGISWCDATFNPWVGCSKVSPGCANCYAETLVQGRMGRPGTWGDDGVREVTAATTWAKPRMWARMAQKGMLPGGIVNLDGHRPRVFCASLADVFEDRPEVTYARVALFDLIEATPDLDWLLLTKRPEFARDWLNAFYFGRDNYDRGMDIPLPNVWLGVSVENARHTYRAGVLREIPAVVRFISAEPLLGSLFESRIVNPCEFCGGESTHGHHGTSHAGQCSYEGRESRVDIRGRAPLDLTGIDWLISGGESGGQQARPMHPDWARELRDACEESGVAYHHKQNGAWTPTVTRREDRPSGEFHRDGSFVADCLCSEGTLHMVYRGSAPKAGGKLLDGVEHCSFPREAVTA